MTFITNFNISRLWEDIVYGYIQSGGKTNLENLLEDFENGSTGWSVAKDAQIGDICIFMCASSAYSNLSMAISHMPQNFKTELIDWTKQEKAYYKRYSGYLLGMGVVSTKPEYDDECHWYYAEINQLVRFECPIHISEFRHVISINRFGSITKLKDDQWTWLKQQIDKKQPTLILKPPTPDSRPPKTRQAVVTQYERNRKIADAVKKQANGYCELCGHKAPFLDRNGLPHLESHHVVWVSQGGSDTINNCVALCPNCHAKMHVVNDPEDVALLMNKAKQHTCSSDKK